MAITSIVSGPEDPLIPCEVCQEPATVFLTQIASGQQTNRNLCEACALAAGMTLPNLVGAECCYCGQPAEQVKPIYPWDVADATKPFSYLCGRCHELHAKATQEFLAKLQSMAANGELAGKDGAERVQAMFSEIERRVRDQFGGA